MFHGKVFALIRQNIALCIACFILLFYFFMLIYLGEDGYYIIHDNLDSELSYRLLPKEAGVLFSTSNNAVVPQLMNGLKRNALYASSYNLITVLFYFFPPFTAYLINTIMVNMIGFAGMYWFLYSFIFKKQKPAFLSAFLALGFTLLPSYTIYGISVSGIPLLVICIINIRNRLRVKQWRLHDGLNLIYLILYPFYSSLILTGFALLFILGIIIIYSGFKYKKADLVLISVFCGFIILYLIAEYNMFNLFLFDHSFIPHRSEYDLNYSHFSFLRAIKEIAALFIKGIYFSPSFHLIIGISLLFPLYIWFRTKKPDYPFLLLFVVIICICVFYGFWKSKYLIPFKTAIPILTMFKIERFYFFLPVLWYFLFGVILYLIYSYFPRWKIISFILIILNLGVVVYKNTQLKENVVAVFNNKNSYGLSYREFFAVDLFNKVKKDINQPLSSFRVGSIGLYPGVVQYNGFYTIDSYQNMYPLSYKKKFREIIERELEKSPYFKQYFDAWGNRCYLFISELENKGYFIIGNSEIKKLELNTKPLKELDCKYIISAVKIENYADNSFKFIRVYDSPETPLKIYLYEII